MEKGMINENDPTEMIDWIYSILEDEESKFIYVRRQ